MQIKNLMSEDIITIDKDQNLSDALKLLRKHNVSRLPVTNNKELVGIISERDIANKLGSSKYESMPASRLHISSVMVKDVFTVPQTMQLEEVAKLMLENGIGSVPVMDDDKITVSGTVDIALHAKIRAVSCRHKRQRGVFYLQPAHTAVRNHHSASSIDLNRVHVSMPPSKLFLSLFLCFFDK